MIYAQNKKYGERLKEFRMFNSIPVSVMANAIGISPVTLSRKEAGKNHFTLEELENIVVSFKTFDVEEFLTGGAKATPKPVCTTVRRMIDEQTRKIVRRRIDELPTMPFAKKQARIKEIIQEEMR